VPEVSPAKRSRIIREVHADPEKKWSGSIGGHRVEIRIVRPFGACWRVCVNRHWHQGTAATVWDALVAVEGPFSPSPCGRMDSEPSARLFGEHEL
jgi:hypothetical protein